MQVENRAFKGTFLFLCFCRCATVWDTTAHLQVNETTCLPANCQFLCVFFFILLTEMFFMFERRYKSDGHCIGIPEFDPPSASKLRWELPDECIQVIEKSNKVNIVLVIFKVVL